MGLFSKKKKGPAVNFTPLDGGDYILDFNGENIRNRVKGYVYGEMLCLYDPETENTFLLGRYNTLNLDTAYEMTVVNTGSTPLLVTLEDNSYYFFIEGNNATEDTRAEWSDNDMIIYYHNDRRQYLFTGAKSEGDTRFYHPAIITSPGMGLFKRLPNNKFYLYVEATMCGGKQMNAVDLFGDILIYTFEFNSYYWAAKGMNLPDNNWIESTCIGRDCKTMWTTNKKNVWIYHEGKNVFKECEYQRNGNDMIAMHQGSMSMFVLSDFYNISDSKLRPVG